MDGDGIITPVQQNQMRVIGRPFIIKCDEGGHKLDDEANEFQSVDAYELSAFVVCKEKFRSPLDLLGPFEVPPETKVS